MATVPGLEKDKCKSACEMGFQVEEAGTRPVSTKQKMYDIDEPPDAQDQFAMFPDRAKGQDNLVYVLMKMEGSKQHLPIVFCADCAAAKFIQYCNGACEYQYEPCDVDKEL